MGWKQIIKESDDSVIGVYNAEGRHQTESYFPNEQLPPMARHEDISDRPSRLHEWNGTSWAFPMAKYKAAIRREIIEKAKSVHDDFENDHSKADILTVLQPFKTQLSGAGTQAAINTIRDNAITALEGM